MVFAFLQLGTGNKAPQPFQITGHTTAVEARHFHLNNLAVLLHGLNPLPALAERQGPGADGDHAIGVLLAGDQHFHLEAFGEALFEVGNGPESAFLFGHESGGFAADIHVNAVALEGDHDPGDHLTGGADEILFVESCQEGIGVEVEVVNAAGHHRGGSNRRGSRCFGCGLASALATGIGTEQIGHGETLKSPHVEELFVAPLGAADRDRTTGGGNGNGSGGRSCRSTRGLQGCGGLRCGRQGLIFFEHQHLGRLARRRSRKRTRRAWGNGPS